MVLRKPKAFEVTAYAKHGCFHFPECIALHSWLGLFVSWFVISHNFRYAPRMSIFSFKYLEEYILFQYAVFKVRICVPAYIRMDTVHISLPGTQMEMVRFELMTPCLQGRCSPN